MSLFKVNVVAVNLNDEKQATPPIECIAETGSELTWLPAELLDSAGIAPVKQRSFYQTDAKRIVQRSVGYAILRVNVFETVDEVVFAEPSDSRLLGQRTFDGLGVKRDETSQQLIPRKAILT